MTTQHEAMQVALKQASFCLRELLPQDPDAQMTVRMIEAALATPAAQPTQERKPLTEQEIWDAVQHGVIGGIGFPTKALAVARAIEAAHGITAQPKEPTA